MAKDHGFTFYNSTTREWEKIPGPCYVVALPIALEIPALRENTLLVHHAINYRHKSGSVQKWAVAHRNTSAVVAYGRTRGDALANAEAKLLSIGNERFLSAIRGVQALIDAKQALPLESGR